MILMKQTTLPRPQRRALNLIWTAAGDYSFVPEFTAFRQDGEPDFYMNSIIGYARKWYDPQIMDDLYEKIRRSFFSETLDGLLWVALENCTFEREVQERPVLAEYRIRYARDFFDQELTRSRQQWMAQNSLVYALQAARCRIILGKAPGLSNPWERNLFLALQYDGSMSARQIHDRTLQVFHRFFPAFSFAGKPSIFLKLQKRLHRFFLSRLPSRLIRTDTLLMNGMSGAGGRIVEGRRGLETSRKHPSVQKADRLYIEGCFGQPLYPDTESDCIEEQLCTGAHKNCHIYFTDGSGGSAPSSDPAVNKTRQSARNQFHRNKAHFQGRHRFYEGSIRRLTDKIRNCLLVYPQPASVCTRSGRLTPSRIWRALYLDDALVFADTLNESEADFSVDLMLDASASRLEHQEIISAQAYVIARSLQLCHIPVQVFSFLSIRGYTVMQRFLSYQDKDREQDEQIFRYFAAGWNRDGLALRGAGQLMKASSSRNRLLIILTDASPNDDHRISPDTSEKRLISHDYSGPAGIRDTASEIRSLRKDGIHVCGILTGSDADTKSAKEMFGNEFVRIEKMERFSDAAGVLIQRQIQQMTRR